MVLVCAVLAIHSSSRETKQTQNVKNTYVWRQMFWRVSVFRDNLHGLEVLFFFFPVWYRASSPSFVRLPWSPKQWPLGSVWWTWSRSWAQGSCLCHQPMCCGAPVLQTGFNLPARRCSKAARVPRAADDLLQNVVFAIWSRKSHLSQEDRKGAPNFPMLQCEVVLGFFCSFMHIFLIWIQAWCHLPSLPQCICGFSHTLITSTTSP